MDKRLEIRCTDVQLERWKSAAGDVALAKWIRRRLDEAALFLPSDDLVAVVVKPDEGVATNPVMVPASTPPYREFRPDFGSRLKKEGKK